MAPLSEDEMKDIITKLKVPLSFGGSFFTRDQSGSTACQPQADLMNTPENEAYKCQA